MMSLFRAEWQKIAGNRMVTIMTIWIFPIGAFVIMLLASGFIIFSPAARQQFLEVPPNVFEQMNIVWQVINNQFGRMILLIFAAYVFAAEYQWGTWKNIIPRRSRTALVMTKFLTLGVYIVCAFTLMMLIVGIGTLVLNALAGADVGAALRIDDPSATARSMILQAGVALASALFAAVYTALGGMFTRSIMGGIVVGFILTLAEQSLYVITFLFYSWLPSVSRFVSQLASLTPAHQLANIGTYVQFNTPFNGFQGASNLGLTLSLETSIILLIAWVIGLIGLLLYIFRRQDILG